MKNILLLIFLGAFLFSCDIIDSDGDDVETPNVTYSETNLKADFYTSGGSSLPNITWNGNQGSFALDSNIDGLSVNSTTGQISWTKLLPVGTHNFSVVVSNSAGQINIPMVIENPLEGNFTGVYNGGAYFAIDFSSDGALTIYANSESNPDIGTGTWEMNGDEIISDYEYEETMEEYSLRVNLNQTNSSAELEGHWYFSHGAENDNEGGDLFLEFSQN